MLYIINKHLYLQFRRSLLNQTAEVLAGQQAAGLCSLLQKKENLLRVTFILK